MSNKAGAIYVFSLRSRRVGEVGAVYDLDAKAWLMRERADNLDDGEHRAEAFVKQLLREAPQIDWKQRKQ